MPLPLQPRTAELLQPDDDGGAAENVENPEARYERGVTAAAMGLVDLAVDDFRAVTVMEPDHRRAWCALAAVQRRRGDRAGANAAAQRAAVLPPQLPAKPKPVPAARIEKSLRRLRKQIAQTPNRDPADLVREHLCQFPTDTGALRFLAALEREQHDIVTACALLERAIELNPTDLAAREEAAGMLLHARREAEAMPHIDHMLAQKPFSTEYRSYKVAALSALGDFVTAARLGDTMAEGNKRAAFWLNHARALRFSGRRAESEAAFRKCIALDAGMGEAYWGLSYVQKAPFTDTDIAAIRAALDSDRTTAVNRFHFHYALGNALEKSGDYAESFVHYAEGARTCRSVNEQDGEAYSAREHTDLIARMTRVFSAELLQSAHAAPAQGPTPIFIVGMPRSGSTLLEQILAGHSMVEATQELPDLDHIVQDIAAEAVAAGTTYPECVASFTALERAALAQRYMDRTRIYRKTDRPFFVDKMPFNWEKAGLIRLLLPQARIIDARRHPIACCFSAFKQLIARGAGYSCDLTDIGLYYRDYMALMAHIDRAAPGAVHRVIYERMVDDSEAEIRRLLACCDLPFEPGCLRFWETSRSVATPSVEQVRQPIFRDALDQWRHYAPWLGPLLAALGDAPTTYAA